MVDVENRIMKLGAFFKEMQITQVEGTNVIYIVVQFPPNWIIEDDITDKFKVSVMEGNMGPGEYYFCADISEGFDAVFDAIDHCVQVNKDAMERAQIFQEKVKKLKEIFGNEQIGVEELRGLEFVVGKKKPAPKKRKTPLDEVAEQEIKEDDSKEE